MDLKGIILIMFIAVIKVTSGHFPEPYLHDSLPYSFGYDIKDHHGEQFREESGHGHEGVKGSYGFTDDRGIHRLVHYVADHEGFRAHVKTNEPGTANEDPAAVHITSLAHPYHEHHELPLKYHEEYHHGYGPDGYRPRDELNEYGSEYEGYGY
ncbi:cuticle protein 16.8-like [Uloborus diversus]|uniref:cuticle protein 16.8-like n=1 Tax=Uloborus diversus TaxID=327109 RepID=UPI002409A0DE|nr:cuticle protein 16.8-like [Uloborus diversus]